MAIHIKPKKKNPRPVNPMPKHKSRPMLANGKGSKNAPQRVKI